MSLQCVNIIAACYYPPSELCGCDTHCGSHFHNPWSMDLLLEQRSSGVFVCGGSLRWASFHAVSSKHKLSLLTPLRPSFHHSFSLLSSFQLPVCVIMKVSSLISLPYLESFFIPHRSLQLGQPIQALLVWSLSQSRVSHLLLRTPRH